MTPRVVDPAQVGVAESPWFLAKIDAVEETGAAVRRALGNYPAVLEQARADWLAGRTMSEIAQRHAIPGRERRVAIMQAFRQYEHALLELRAAVVRIQVDDEGVRLSQLAQSMGVTRQTVTRLYRAGGDRA